MSPADKEALARIVGGSIDEVRVSCSFGVGHGGAIGPMQFLPTTWEDKRDKATRNPWDITDALTVGALKLKADGGITNPYQAACKYFGKCSFGGVDYATQVVGTMNSIKEQGVCPYL